ncbi:uncharacterized protein LOC129923618 [Biomphalaria glabrata]|uniref:Uncharacterized protein LOC129923618 n=1 Tax=Biomphalaria glabrata TaxID=6526 RepID=A0A9W2Z8I3_BIOGL|nr:uncharacterized protein LOC129923618 [Biomphalaria glabrata]
MPSLEILIDQDISNQLCENSITKPSKKEAKALVFEEKCMTIPMAKTGHNKYINKQLKRQARKIKKRLQQSVEDNMELNAMKDLTPRENVIKGYPGDSSDEEMLSLVMPIDSHPHFGKESCQVDTHHTVEIENSLGSEKTPRFSVVLDKFKIKKGSGKQWFIRNGVLSHEEDHDKDRESNADSNDAQMDPMSLHSTEPFNDKDNIKVDQIDANIIPLTVQKINADEAEPLKTMAESIARTDYVSNESQPILKHQISSSDNANIDNSMLDLNIDEKPEGIAVIDCQAVAPTLYTLGLEAMIKDNGLKEGYTYQHSPSAISRDLSLLTAGEAAASTELTYFTTTEQNVDCLNPPARIVKIRSLDRESERYVRHSEALEEPPTFNTQVMLNDVETEDLPKPEPLTLSVLSPGEMYHIADLKWQELRQGNKISSPQTENLTKNSQEKEDNLNDQCDQEILKDSVEANTWEDLQVLHEITSLSCYDRVHPSPFYMSDDKNDRNGIEINADIDLNMIEPITYSNEKSFYSKESNDDHTNVSTHPNLMEEITSSDQILTPSPRLSSEIINNNQINKSSKPILTAVITSPAHALFGLELPADGSMINETNCDNKSNLMEQTTDHIPTPDQSSFYKDENNFETTAEILADNHMHGSNREENPDVQSIVTFPESDISSEDCSIREVNTPVTFQCEVVDVSDGENGPLEMDEIPIDTNFLYPRRQSVNETLVMDKLIKNYHETSHNILGDSFVDSHLPQDDLLTSSCNPHLGLTLGESLGVSEVSHETIPKATPSDDTLKSEPNQILVDDKQLKADYCDYKTSELLPHGFQLYEISPDQTQTNYNLNGDTAYDESYLLSVHNKDIIQSHDPDNFVSQFNDKEICDPSINTLQKDKRNDSQAWEASSESQSTDSDIEGTVEFCTHLNSMPSLPTDCFISTHEDSEQHWGRSSIDMSDLNRQKIVESSDFNMHESQFESTSSLDKIDLDEVDSSLILSVEEKEEFSPDFHSNIEEISQLSENNSINALIACLEEQLSLDQL